MEMSEKHLESILRTAEKVVLIDEKLDAIADSHRDHELRIRDLERRDAVIVVIENLQSTAKDHEERIVILEHKEGSRASVQIWKDMTLVKLAALLGATGGACALLGWLVGLFGGGI